MTTTDTATLTRTVAAMVAENDAREFVADIERLIAPLDAA
jgi:hypothetical protein